MGLRSCPARGSSFGSMALLCSRSKCVLTLPGTEVNATHKAKEALRVPPGSE